MPFIIELKRLNPLSDVFETEYITGTQSNHSKPKTYKRGCFKHLAKRYTRRAVAQKVVDTKFKTIGRVVPV